MNINRVIALLCIVMMIVAGCRKAAEKTTEKVVHAGKEAVGGISEGIEKGRKSSTGADGAVIISTAKELEGKGKISVFSIRHSDGTTAAELAVENLTDNPLELIGLRDTGACRLLDSSGFTWTVDSRSPSSFTVLPKSMQKLTLSFQQDSSGVASISVYGVAYPAKAAQTSPAE